MMVLNGHEDPLPGRSLRVSCGIVSRSSNMLVDGGTPITERIATGWPGRRAARCACGLKGNRNRRIEPDPQGHARLAYLLQKRYNPLCNGRSALSVPKPGQSLTPCLWTCVRVSS